MEKKWRKKPSFTAGGNIHWYPLYETVWRFLKKLSIVLKYGPATPLLDIHPNLKTFICKARCTPRFTAALSAVAKTSKTTEVSLDHWINQSAYL